MGARGVSIASWVGDLVGVEAVVFDGEV